MRRWAVSSAWSAVLAVTRYSMMAVSLSRLTSKSGERPSSSKRRWVDVLSICLAVAVAAVLASRGLSGRRSMPPMTFAGGGTSTTDACDSYSWAMRPPITTMPTTASTAMGRETYHLRKTVNSAVHRSTSCRPLFCSAGSGSRRGGSTGTDPSLGIRAHRAPVS
jgi:hypothetical protein